MSTKSTVFGRRVPKEWDFIFYQLYRFQKMPKRIRPKSAITIDSCVVLRNKDRLCNTTITAALTDTSIQSQQGKLSLCTPQVVFKKSAVLVMKDCVWQICQCMNKEQKFKEKLKGFKSLFIGREYVIGTNW